MDLSVRTLIHTHIINENEAQYVYTAKTVSILMFTDLPQSLTL